MKKLINAAVIAVMTLVAVPLLPSMANADNTLTIAYGSDRYKFDDKKFTFTMTGPASWITENAARPGDDFWPEPQLFTSWTIQDGLYQATVREGVTFHNGTPLDAAKVVDAIRLYGKSKSDFTGIDYDTLKAVDHKTVEFRSKTGSFLTLNNMTHRMVGFLEADANRSTLPVGTGPYKFESYTSKQSLSVVRNDNYWGEKPKVERIVYKFIPDSQTRLMALLNGEVDIIGDADPKLLLSLPESGPFQVLASRPVQYIALLVNRHGKAPFNKLQDRRIREAMALSIDRDTLAKIMFRGKGVPAKGVLPSWMFGLGDDHVKGFGYNPERAAAILDEAGWKTGADGVREKNGERLTLRLVAAYPDASRVNPMPEMLQQMFLKVGIDIDLVETNDSGVYYGSYMEKGEADLFMEAASNNNSDPTYLLYNLFHSKGAWIQYGYEYTVVGPEFDKALDAARASGDASTVLDRVRDAHREMIDTRIAAIPILMVPNFIVTKPGIKMPVFEHRDWVDYGNATLP